MRDFMDAILLFIGASSLTDAEYASINVLPLTVGVYDVALYAALSAVLIARESVSQTQDRLRYFFLSKGVSVGTVSAARSNILIGGGLW